MSLAMWWTQGKAKGVDSNGVIVFQIRVGTMPDRLTY